MRYQYSLLLISLSTFLAGSVFSQDILLEKSLGVRQADYLMYAEPIADYGFILAGSSLSKKSVNKTQDKVK
jgi:hypothetical protein